MWSLTPLEIRLGICIYKTPFLHRPDDYIGFTPSCLPHILQQNCAHAYVYNQPFHLMTIPLLFGLNVGYRTLLGTGNVSI